MRKLLVLSILTFFITILAHSQNDPCNPTELVFNEGTCSNTTSTFYTEFDNSTGNYSGVPYPGDCPVSGGLFGCGTLFENSNDNIDLWFEVTVPVGANQLFIDMNWYDPPFFTVANPGYAIYSENPANCNTPNYLIGTCDGDCSLFPTTSFSENLTGLTPGETYLIRVWEVDDQSMNFDITVETESPAEPSNDDCVNAQDLTGFGCNYGADATNEPNSWAPDPGGSICNGASGTLNWGSNENGVWYTFEVTPTTDQPISIGINGVICNGINGGNLQMGLWSNTGTCDLSSETFYDCALGNGTLEISNVTLPVGDYYLFVDGFGGDECIWNFESDEILPPPTQCPTYLSAVAQPTACGNQPFNVQVPLDNCPGILQMAVQVITDNWGEEFYWYMVNNTTGLTIASGGNQGGGGGANAGYADNSTFNISVGPLDPSVDGTSYTIFLEDSFGDAGCQVIVTDVGNSNVLYDSGTNWGDGSTTNSGFVPQVFGASTVTVNWTEPDGNIISESLGACGIPNHNFILSTTNTCQSENQTISYEIVCDNDGSIITTGNVNVLVAPAVPTDPSNLVSISINPTTCLAEYTYQNDCTAAEMTITEVVAPIAGQTGNAEYTVTYTGPGTTDCCSTGGPMQVFSQSSTDLGGTISPVLGGPVNSPFGGTNNSELITWPAPGTGGLISSSSFTVSVNNYNTNFPIATNPAYWVTIVVDGIIVYDAASDPAFSTPAFTGSVTITDADILAAGISPYNENSVVEAYVYPNAFEYGVPVTSVTYIPGSPGALADGQWSADVVMSNVTVTYTDMVSTPADCDFTVNAAYSCCTDPIVTNQSPIICTTSPTSIQDLTSYESAINNSGTVTFDWYSDIGLTMTVPTPSSTSVANGDVFYVEVSEGSCSSTATVTFTLESVDPMITSNGTTLHCNLTTITLDAGAGFDSYTWSDASNTSTQTLDITAPGTYTVTVTSNSCPATASINISENASVTTTNLTETCDGSNTNYVVSFDISGGSGNYLINNVPIAGSTYTSAPISSGSMYTFQVEDDLGCEIVTPLTGTVICSPNACSSSSGCFGPNLIINGDFEAGNSGFNSDYDFSPCPGTVCTNATTGAPILCQYDYGIGSNPNDCNADWPSTIVDHTSGSGNMMIVDFPAGNVAPNNNIWCQTVTVNANTDYCFSAYFINLLAAGSNQPEPVFEFTVDGLLIGTTASLSESEQWENEGFQFNSNASTSVDICIKNSNFGNIGFDLAIDDISLQAIGGGVPPTLDNDSGILCSNESSVTVDVLDNDTPTTTFNLSTLSIESAPPFTEGSITAIDAVNGTITFTPSLGFSGSTSFSYQICDNNGCCDIADVNISAATAPVVTGSTTDIACNPLGGAINISITGGTMPFTYDWSDNNFDGMEDIIVSTAGIYTLTVTDGNGCTGSNNFTVSLNNAFPTADISSTTTILDCNNTSITMDASGSNGAGNITYLWSDNSLNPTLSVNTTGTYTVTVTDDTNGCTASTSVTITQDITAPTADISSVTTVLDCNTTSISLDASGSSGTGNITYLWSDNSSNATLNVNSAGTYSVTVTDDANGCTASTSITITQDITAPTADISSVSTALDCNTTSISLDASGSSGTGNITYLWSDNSSNATLNVNAAGTYSVTVTDDANGCTASTSITITQDITAPTADISSVSTALDCNTTSISLDASGSSGTGNITYLWSDNSSNATLNVNAAGTYSVTVTDDANGCTASTSVTITQDITAPTADINSTTTTLDCNNANITLDASGSSGTGNITYLWSDNSSNATLSVNAAGTYTVTITDDANGCTASTSVTITQDITAPTADITSTTTTLDCNNANITLDASGSSGTGNITYLWSDNSSNTTLNVNAAGTYSVTITDDANGCTASTSVTITQDPSVPTADISSSTTELNCNTSNIILDASGSSGTGNITYLWSDNSSNVTLNVNTAGTYTVTVTDDANGCTALANITITQNITTPTADITSTTTTLNCNTSNITLDAAGSSGSGNITYLWSDNSTNGTLSVNTAGTYTVTVTDDANGCTAATSVTITQNITAPTADISSTNTVLDCNTANITLDAAGSSGSGIITYLWSDNSTNATLSVNAAGTYAVTVTDDANGCTAATTVIITQDIAAPTADISSTTTILDCNNTSITLDAAGSSGTGNITYVWSDNSTNATLNVNVAGIYSVTVTDDANGCTAATSVTITQDIAITTPTITSSEVEFNCNISNITLDAGMGYDSYIWSNNEVSQTIDITMPGDYTVTVSEPNGCTATNSITIGSTATLAANITGDLSICQGETTTLDATNANATSYLWSTNETTAMIDVNMPGTYSVTISDGTCTAETSVIIALEAGPTPTITGDNVICNGDNTTLDAGAGYSSYSWSNGETGQTISISGEGTYTVTVSNSSGCTGTDEFNVIYSFEPVFDVIDDATICLGGSIAIGTIEAQGTSYTWTANPADISLESPDIGTPTVSPEVTTTYTLVATYGNCSQTESVTIFVEDPSLVVTGASICAGEVATLSATGTPAGGTYTWTDWQGNEVGTGSDIQVSPFDATSYQVTYNVGACTISDVVEVDVITDPNISISASSTDILLGEEATLDVNNAPFGSTYVWTATSGDDPFGDESVNVYPTEETTYTVEVTTPEGCVYYASVTISVTSIDISIPNIFTPNGDEMNDEFYIVNGDLSNEIIEFKVFDRWGELVHDNASTPWDGTRNGKNMPSDIYVYMFTIRAPNGDESVMKGDIALMR